MKAFVYFLCIFACILSNHCFAEIVAPAATPAKAPIAAPAATPAKAPIAAPAATPAEAAIEDPAATPAEAPIEGPTEVTEAPTEVPVDTAVEETDETASSEEASADNDEDSATGTSDDAVEEVVESVSDDSCPPNLKEYSRGVGKIPSSCREGYAREGLLCYPECRDDEDGILGTCWKKCKHGYVNAGALCQRATELKPAKTGRCPWYDICGLGLAQGCSDCPEGFDNDGCICRRDVGVYARKSRARSPVAMKCNSQTQDTALGLCYKKCRSGYKGMMTECVVKKECYR